MFKKPLSLVEFILQDQKNYPQAHGDFTFLLTQLEYAGKIISSHIRRAGLVDILGKTGDRNASSDEVKKIDVFTNDLLIDVLKQTKQVKTIGSEELESPITQNNGTYDIYFDPLDGSSNMDTNGVMGTIFSIYHTSDSLQSGDKQVAAGYILYGPSTLFIYTCGHGVNGFTLDPSIGTFLLSHPNIQIPKKGNMYHASESYYPFWDTKTQGYIDSLKTAEKPYKSRNMGALVADAHQILQEGGIFLYPATPKNPKGKLRLLYEVNPISFLIEQAGGSVLSDTTSPLSIVPSDYHQKVPFVFGSTDDVTSYKNFAPK